MAPLHLFQNWEAIADVDHARVVADVWSEEETVFVPREDAYCKQNTGQRSRPTVLMGFGILISPYDTEESKRFSVYTKAVGVFASGYFVGKIDKLVEKVFGPEFVFESVHGFRIIAFLSAAIVAMLITFIYRWYATVSGNVYLAVGSTDIRKAINGLSILVEQAMDLNPFSDDLFVFCNRQRTIIKTLYWDHNGFCLWHKRLEKYRFKWPSGADEAIAIEARQLSWLLAGLNFTSAHERLYYSAVA